MQATRSALSAVFLATLASCGGGGGNGGGVPPVPVDNSWLALTPSNVQLSVYAGETTGVTITAVSSKQISQHFNVAIIDPVGVISPDVKIEMVTPLEYRASLTSAQTLSVGAHTTTLEVRLCEDDPLVCAKPISGSPWKVPFTVTVKSQTNLTPLSKLPQLQTWSGFQGNSLHSGYAPASFDPSTFSRRWQWTASGRDMPGDVAVDDGQVFVVTRVDRQPWTVRAVDESTGKENWSTTLERSEGMSAAAAAQGQVVLKSMGSSGWNLWFLDQKTGAVLRKQAVPWGGRYASLDTFTGMPTIAGGNIFIAQASFLPGMGMYSLSSGDPVWGVSWQGQDYDWTPAVDANYAYIAPGGTSLEAYDVRDGKQVFAIGYVEGADYRDPSSTPVLSGSGMAYAYDFRNTLHAYDLGKSAPAWSLYNIDSGPVATATTVYALARNGLTAYDAQTGVRQWTAELTRGCPFDTRTLLVTDNLLFASGDATCAIDLRTHTMVWTHPRGGSLALSDRGVLYITSGAGIDAINLK